MNPEERLVQSSQKDAESRLNGSGFIAKYVNDHKQELAELRAKANLSKFEGSWVIIGDEGYQGDRLQYATTSFEEREVSPRIILYPAGEEDIQKAILLCRELGMAIAVRTGGHQYCGYSSTSPVNMQIDLSKGKDHAFDKYSYDSENNVLTCGPYQALGDWAAHNRNPTEKDIIEPTGNQEAETGIYLPMGVCASVHLGGHVHTGGWGMVARSHGLLADHVLAFDIILASGEKERIVRPEAGKTTRHNDDLYYAVLGGSKGGEFGIVTQWEFQPLRNQDYPNAACYSFAWIWSKERMERVVQHLAELSKRCASGEIPSDYEFMLNITGGGEMHVLPELLQNALRYLGLRRLDNRNSRTALVQAPEGEQELTEVNKFRNELSALGFEATQDLDLSPESSADESNVRGILDGDLWIPPLIQMWMCFTNKGGQSEQFDDQWFESFAQEDVCGKPPWWMSPQRLKKTPISTGLAEHFIMKQNREMEYPFVKRFRVTLDVPEEFPKVYAERMYQIMHGRWGTDGKQHLVSQQQIYAGGAVAENGKSNLTSYSWREQALAMSYDSFYSEGYHQEAEQWQGQNDEVFIENKAFADQDMRMFAYTFGDNVLEKENVWSCYYDSKEKYERLRGIKWDVDRDRIFSADQFSLKPLPPKIPE